MATSPEPSPRAPAQGVSLHDIDRVQPGLDLFTSGHGPVAVLMDMDGVVLNEWRVGFDELFPDHPTPNRAPSLGALNALRRARQAGDSTPTN